MKNLKLILTTAIFALIFVSCSDDDKNKPIVAPTISKQVTNLHAPAQGGGANYSGPFTKFSFKTGAVVTGDNWDIAFRATQIIVNGGAKIGLPDELNRTGQGAISLQTGTFANIKQAPADAAFKKDAQGAYALPWGSGKGWYVYTGPPTHAINPIAGKVIVVKTHDGRYAKMEIISYYKDKDRAKGSRYFTFDYVYNPNAGDKELQ